MNNNIDIDVLIKCLNRHVRIINKNFDSIDPQIIRKNNNDIYHFVKKFLATNSKN